MPTTRRLWDASIIIGYLGRDDNLQADCDRIIQQAELGEVEIVVSEMAKVETAYLTGYSDSESEVIIQGFFNQDYVISVIVDNPVSTVARSLVRKYRTGPKLNPPDAVHLATAIYWNIPVFETTDNGLLRFDGMEGAPPIRVRRPLYEYEGPAEFPGVSD